MKNINLKDFRNIDDVLASKNNHDYMDIKDFDYITPDFLESHLAHITIQADKLVLNSGATDMLKLVPGTKVALLVNMKSQILLICKTTDKNGKNIEINKDDNNTTVASEDIATLLTELINDDSHDKFTVKMQKTSWIKQNDKPNKVLVFDLHKAEAVD